jgi:hypothetical protein
MKLSSVATKKYSRATPIIYWLSRYVLNEEILHLCSLYVSRKDKIGNNIIKQKTNVTRSILDDIKTKQLQLYGHVQRIEEGRLPKEVIKWRPPGRRKRGRPKLTRAEGNRGLMGETGLMEED